MFSRLDISFFLEKVSLDIKIGFSCLEKSARFKDKVDKNLL